MMHWGIATLIGHRHSLENCCREAARLGYEYIELNCVRDYYAHCNALQLADSPEELHRIKRMLWENGLGCSGVDCHGLFGRNLEEFQYTCEYLQAGMRIAAELGAPLVVTSIPRGPTPRPAMVAQMRELCKRAEEYRLGIALEAEYDFAVGPEELDGFLGDVAMSNLNVNFDPSHFVRCGWEITEAVRHFYNRIVHVHLKECFPASAHGTRYSGLADSPCGRMLDELARLGYDGVASAETLAELNTDSENAAAVIMRGIQRWENNRKQVYA